MKKTKLFTSLAAFVLVLGLGACTEVSEETTSEEESTPSESETTTQSSETTGDTTPSESTPEGGDEGGEETYLFGFEVDGTLNYIDGGLVEYNGSLQSHEGSYTTDVADAVRVKVESTETAGEYYLSYVLDDTTYWITIIENGTYINLSYATEAAPLYWNATYNCWGDDTLSYFLCQNATYGCLYCSAIASWINSSPIAGLYTEDGEAYTTGLVGYELPAPTSITVTGKETLYVGSTAQLSVTVEPTNANPDVTWSTSNESYATVSDSGLVTGTGEGTVTITATSVKDTDVSGSIDIVVSEAPAGLTEVKLCSYDFSKKTDTTNSVRSPDQMMTIFSESFVVGEVTSNIVTAVTTADTIYAQAGGSSSNANLQLSTACIKFGKSSTKGELAFTVSNTITKIELQAAGWSGSQPLTINGVQQSITQSAKAVESVDSLTTYTYEIEEATSVDMVTSERVLLFNMTFYGYL